MALFGKIICRVCSKEYLGNRQAEDNVCSECKEKKCVDEFRKFREEILSGTEGDPIKIIEKLIGIIYSLKNRKSEYVPPPIF